MDARTYWDQYYSEKPFAGGKAPASFLVQMLPRLESGKLLDIAMGEGVNAVYLAQKGFQVRGFDLSKVAVEHAKQLARDTGVQIEAQSADLDLYLFGIMEYDCMIMTQFRPPVTRYYTSMMSALKQGGTLLIDSLGVPEMGEALGPDEAHRNIYFSSNEVLRELKGMRILYYKEGIVEGRHRVQCVAQKPIDKDAAKLKLFDMSTKSKDGDHSKHLELAEKFFKK